MQELHELKQLMLDKNAPTTRIDEDLVAATTTNGKKVDQVLEELEHLQYGFQNQMTSYRKLLQGAVGATELSAMNTVRSHASNSSEVVSETKFELLKEITRLEIQAAALKQEKLDLAADVGREAQKLASVRK